MNNENTLPIGVLPSQSLAAYNAEIEASLQKGLEFSRLLKTALESTQPTNLLAAITELLQLQLGSKQVEFPNQYHNNDWYLLLMTRMLELNQVDGYSLASASDHQELGVFLAGSGTKVRYQFSNATTTGAFFTEIETNKRLFYLDLEQQKLTFIGQDIINLFIVQADLKLSATESEAVIDVLTHFANLMAHQLNFTIDYSILETSNDYRFETTATSLPNQVLDKLFIGSAGADILMQPVESGYGARLVLGPELELQFLQVDDGSLRSDLWHFVVLDDQAKASFFNILVNYPFLQRWYLENRDILEVKPLNELGVNPDEHLATEVKVDPIAKSGDENIEPIVDDDDAGMTATNDED